MCWAEECRVAANRLGCSSMLVALGQLWDVRAWTLDSLESSTQSGELQFLSALGSSAAVSAKSFYPPTQVVSKKQEVEKKPEVLDTYPGLGEYCGLMRVWCSDCGSFCIGCRHLVKAFGTLQAS